MPNVTLYERDVGLIRDALGEYKSILLKRKQEHALDEGELEDIVEIERLRDLLLDRLVQRLHPKRS